MSAPILEVRDLQTHFATREGVLKAVDGVSFEIMPGAVLGVVGESGSGKSVTGFSILRLIDPPGRIVGGEVLFKGQNLLALDEPAMRRVRGGRIAMIFQDPMMTLNPVLRIDVQMIEAVRAHGKASRREAGARALEVLRKVGIPSPEDRLRAYPHQLSGGMRQRVAIAIAMLNRPDLIIADEPTTALDVTIQAQILAEAQMLARESGTALLWITHDLSVVSGLADHIAVMYAGRIVEQGPARQVLQAPAHPYTHGLLQALPSRNARGARLFQIPGMTPDPRRLPPGCPFHPRCAKADAVCAQGTPPLRQAAGRMVRCFHPHQKIAC